MPGMISNHPALIKMSLKPKDKMFQKNMENTLRNIYYLLTKSGLHLNYLGAEEPYPCTFFYDLGYIDEFKEYATRISEIFHKANAKRIITVDPYTYDFLKNTYPKYVNDFDFPIVPYLDFVRIPLSYRDIKVTLQEPCHFALRSQVYSAEIKI
ncbi:MAG: (Fe-S)-binding protein [Nitrososphaerota archaeon]